MNYEELLHKYFDGALDEQQEAALFVALSHDTELRREFNDYVSLGSVVQGEAARNTLPASLSASVFKELGYSLPPAFGVVTSSESRSISGGLLQYGAYILTSVLSSALTALVILFFLQPSSSSQLAKQKIPVVIQSEKRNSETPKQVLPQKAVVEKTVPVPVRSYHREIVSEENRKLDADPADNAVITRNIEEEHEAIENAELRRVEQMMVHTQKYTLPAIASSDSFLMSASSNLGLDVAVRSSVSRSFPSVSLPEHNAGLMNNITVAAFYSLSDNHATGIEFGRETFGQEYRHTLRGNGVTVRQNPMLWWAGASYRMEFPDMALLPDMVYPYSQATIGMSEVGPLGRFLLGIRFIPEQKIVFSLGVEGSLLAYPVENQWYSTTKLGLTYGISVRF